MERFNIPAETEDVGEKKGPWIKLTWAQARRLERILASREAHNEARHGTVKLPYDRDLALLKVIQEACEGAPK